MARAMWCRAACWPPMMSILIKPHVLLVDPEGMVSRSEHCRK